MPASAAGEGEPSKAIRGDGRQARRWRAAGYVVLAAALLLSGSHVRAAPAGGEVVFGSASFSQTGTADQTTTTIHQSSNELTLGWQSFNVGTDETVNFVQPGASALALNRMAWFKPG
jgi:large exoprotein involved in heme utilization and adhesion